VAPPPSHGVLYADTGDGFHGVSKIFVRGHPNGAVHHGGCIGLDGLVSSKCHLEIENNAILALFRRRKRRLPGRCHRPVISWDEFGAFYVVLHAFADESHDFAIDERRILERRTPYG
jgi:hypothetical protein